MNLTNEERLILLSVKIHPTDYEIVEINKLILRIRNWDYLIKNIVERGCAPLLYVKLPLLSNKLVIPENIIRKLKKTYYLTLNRSIKLQKAFVEIMSEFNFDGISVIALKGIYLSEWLYKDIGLRQFSDLDLLIHEEDSEKCFSILKKLGFHSYDGIESEEVGGQKDLMHYKPRVNENDISVELHIKTQHKNVKYNMSINEIWHNSVSESINGTDIRALGFTDNIIYLILHLDKHFHSNHIQFTCFNDVTNILTEYSSIIDWDNLKLKCREYSCEDIVFKYIILVEHYFKAPIPDFIHNEYLNLLIKKDKKQFINHLRGLIFTSFVPDHISLLKTLPNSTTKLKYLISIVFPSKSFMIAKYNIKNTNLTPLFYIYRYYIGIKGLIKSTTKN